MIKYMQSNKKTRFLSHVFKNSKLIYRGSYELDFLEKYFNIIKISKAPTIRYKVKSIEYYYFPDYYIPSLNLIIEIKSNWIYKRQNLAKINAKKKATIANGFDYIMILDKNYAKFNEKISN